MMDELPVIHILLLGKCKKKISPIPELVSIQETGKLNILIVE